MTETQTSLLNCIDILHDNDFINIDKSNKLKEQVRKGDKHAYDVVSILLCSCFTRK